MKFQAKSNLEEMLIIQYSGVGIREPPSKHKFLLMNNSVSSGGRILPSDLGGTGEMGPLDNTPNLRQLRPLQSYFSNILSYGYD